MLEQIDQAFCSMQAALVARELYDAQHPVVTKSQSDALRLLNGILAQSPIIQVMAVERRIVVNGETLPSSATLSAGLFSRLRQFEFDGLMIRRGVKVEELDTLLKSLAPTASVETFPKLVGIAPIRVSEKVGLAPTDRRSNEMLIAPPTNRLIIPRNNASAIAPMLAQIVRDGSLDDSALGNVVSNITAVVHGAESTIIPLASLKQHDEYTYVHTINVGLLSAALAEGIGLSGDRLFDLTSAALLHDVGKRLVPIELLNKPGKLTDDEFKLVKSHPELGAKLLLSLPSISPIVPIVAYEHHMNRTGGGYPNVAPGWKMHLASQIVQIADVFDALRTHRPYRDAMSLDKVRELMFEEAGKAYDPELLEVFFEHVSCNTDRDMADELMPEVVSKAA